MPIRFTSDLLESSTDIPPLGCRYCDRGTKMVLYITGICSRDCFYCPLSEQKKGKDVIFANERRVEGDDWLDQIILEARSMKALGTGITGGDPLLYPDRTLAVIENLKTVFGSRHHIHLYTSGPFKPEILFEVKDSGLDEIRFHPPVECWKGFAHLGSGSVEGDPGPALTYHDLIEEARKVGLSTGLEIPAVPDPVGAGGMYSEGLRVLLDYAARENIEFVNINELEASHTNAEDFRKRGYELIGISMAVHGSMDLAWKTVDEVKKLNTDSSTVFHVCSSVYKDAVQLRNRLKRMARNIIRPYEIATEDGTLIRGVIEAENIDDLMNLLSTEYEVPDDLLEKINDSKIHIAPWIIEEIGEELSAECYLSEVYPTYDGLEVERTPIGFQ